MLSSHPVFPCDCIDGMNVQPSGGAHLIFADPPFNIGYEYDQYDDKRKDSEYLAWCSQWLNHVYRLIKSDGSFWLAIGDKHASDLDVLCRNEFGFKRRSWVIWYYTFGVNSVKKFTPSHTHLFHYVVDEKNFTFNAEAIKVPSARQLVYSDKRAKKGGRLPDDTWILRPQQVEDAGGLPPDHDVWHVPRVAGTFKEREGFHGCQMPESILERIIKVSSNEGDLVIDPFVGSGTTGVAAKRLNRKFIGFEISPEYAAKAQERIDATQA